MLYGKSVAVVGNVEGSEGGILYKGNMVSWNVMSLDMSIELVGRWMTL